MSNVKLSGAPPLGEEKCSGAAAAPESRLTGRLTKEERKGQAPALHSGTQVNKSQETAIIRVRNPPVSTVEKS